MEHGTGAAAADDDADGDGRAGVFGESGTYAAVQQCTISVYMMWRNYSSRENPPLVSVRIAVVL